MMTLVTGPCSISAAALLQLRRCLEYRHESELESSEQRWSKVIVCSTSEWSKEGDVNIMNELQSMMNKARNLSLAYSWADAAAQA